MMKKTKKKAKGLEARIAREEFLQELKTPTPKVESNPSADPSADETADEILKKIRERSGIKPYTPKKNINPYNAGPGGAADNMWKSLRKMAGITK